MVSAYQVASRLVGIAEHSLLGLLRMSISCFCEYTPKASGGTKRVGSMVISSDEFNRLSGKFRRMCEPKRHSGKIEVPDNIFELYQAKGTSKERLFEAFVKTGGDKDKVQLPFSLSLSVFILG